MQLIPAIDLRGGRCVRLLQGRFDAETIYAEDPIEIIDRYLAFGARQVHVVDLDGARDGSQANRNAIEHLVARAGRATLQVGGGVRTRQVADALLGLGIARVVVGSTAVAAPDEVACWLRDLGPDRVVLAFDVRLDEAGTPRLTTHGWETQTATSLWEAVERFAPAGLRHVLCTDVARDGALTGPNLALYGECVRRYPEVQWQASGGVSASGDLHALATTGVAAVISGRALLENRLTQKDMAPFLPAA